MTRKISDRPNAQMRHKARQKVLQALYQWHMSSPSISQIEGEFYADNDMSKIDVEYFREVLHAVPAQKSELDSTIQDYIDRPIAKLTPIELAILRLGAYELMHRIDVPYRVVINEAVELCKTYGANEAHKYINGVLDKMAQNIRLAEVGKAKK